MEQSEPTISSILLELAAEYNGIVSEREVFERVLARRPSQAKDPYASIRNKLRYDAIERLDKLEAKAERVMVPLAYTDELYALRSAIEMVRKRLREAPAAAAP